MLHSNLPSTNQKVGSSSLFRRAIENGYPLGCPFSIYHSSAEEETRRRVCQERSAKSLRTQAKTLRGSVFNESGNVTLHPIRETNIGKKSYHYSRVLMRR